MSIVGGEYSIDGGNYLNSSISMINNGQSISIRQTTANSFATQTDITLTINDISSTFSVTTIDDNQAPRVDIQFPPSNSLIDKETILVRGTAQDIGDSEIISLNVNGIEATSSDDFLNWQALVPLIPGENVLTVEVRDEYLNEDNNAAQSLIRFEENINILPLQLSKDTTNNRVLVNEAGSTLVWIDLSTHQRTVLSDENGIGGGPNFSGIQDIKVDIDNNRVLVMTFDALLSVDLVTGNRTIISDANTGGGVDFGIFRGRFDIDIANNRVLAVMSDGVNLILSIDLATGARSILSGENNGSGPRISGTRNSGIAVDNNFNRVLVVTDSNDLYSVDLTTGNRIRVSGGSTGTGPSFNSPNHITLDSTNNRILLSDLNLDSPTTFLVGAIIEVDLSTGNRSNILEINTDSGLQLTRISDITLDSVNGNLLITDRDPEVLISVNLDNDETQTLYDWSINNGTGPLLGENGDIAIDIENNRIIALSVINNITFERFILSIDLDSGNRTLISGNNRGDGTNFVSPVSIIYDNEGDQAFIIDISLDALISIDLTTGNRTIISNDQIGSGQNFNSPRDLALDSANNRIIVLDAFIGILSVDLDTGNRTVLSSSNVGSGENFLYLTSISLDITNNTAYVSDEDNSALFQVDLTTGNRLIASDDSIGSGVSFESPNDLILDIANNRIIVADAGYDDELGDIGLLSVNLNTGDRNLITFNRPVRGGYHSNLALDSDNNTAFLLDYYLTAVDLTTGEWVIKSK